MVDCKHGKIQLDNLCIHKFTRQKDIEQRKDWELFLKTSDYAHFAYMGDVDDPDVYAIHLCFKRNKLIEIYLWPQSEHCAYHCIEPDHPSQDIHYFYHNLDTMAKEVSAWLHSKQGSNEQKYSWGRVEFLNDTKRNYFICVRIIFS